MPWQVIPQTVYDLVGRILPGAVVLFIVLLVARTFNIGELPGLGAALKDLVSPSSLTVGLVASYTVGLILGQLYAVTVGRLLAKRDKEIETRCRTECLEEHKRTLDALGQSWSGINAQQFPRTFVMHDHLRLVAPTETRRLLKVRAERRMSEVIGLGAILAVLANTVLVVMEFSYYRSILEAILLLTVVGAWRSSERRFENFTNGTTIMWLMHATEGPFQPFVQRTTSSELPNYGLQATAAAEFLSRRV